MLDLEHQALFAAQSRRAVLRTSAKIMAAERADAILRPSSSTVWKRSASESVARWPSRPPESDSSTGTAMAASTVRAAATCCSAAGCPSD